ncbi:MAG: RimK/LysX family protein [Fulvivirga sp.]|uniref:ATP-dependent zinc protease family protein n=1 Tax=Fulvivirga sp. TaxID=1931237 RepID=UPI0032EA9F69
MKKDIIGRNEVVDLPEMELFQLRAKIDTGAYTSAIHYHHAEVIKKDGEETLHFTLLDPSHAEYNDKDFYFKKFKTKKIKNSFGQSEERYIIEATIRIFDKNILTEFSLSDRGNLKFPLLLGRKLLNKHFIVDTSKKNLSLKSSKK